MKFLLKILIFSILLLTSIADEDIIDVVSSTADTTTESGNGIVRSSTESSGTLAIDITTATPSDVSFETQASPTGETQAQPTRETQAQSTAETQAQPTRETQTQSTAETQAQPTRETQAPPTRETQAPPTRETKENLQTTEPSIVTTEAATADPYMDFNFTCDAGTCTYKLSGPQAGPAEISIVNEGSELWPNASAETYQLQQDFSLLSGEIADFLNGLNDTYNLLEGEISDIEQQIILNNNTLDQAVNNIANLTATLNSFSVRDCYYQSCLIVTQPPTTTTTPTRPTTPNVCESTNCNGVFCPDVSYNGTCTSSGGIALCQCVGNLNPKQNCQQAGCGSGINYMKLQGVSAPFWSPNYNSCLSDSNMANEPSYAKNIDCTWKLDLTSQNLRININPTNLTAIPNFPEGKFSVTTPVRTQPYIINPTPDPCTLQKLLYVAVNRESPPWVTIRFQSTNNVPVTGAYFDWTITSVTSTPAPLTCSVG